MCSIAITDVFGRESVAGAGPDEVVVTGTATLCDRVCVRGDQTQPVNINLPQKCVPVDAAGQWTVTYRVADGDFTLGDFLCGRGNKWSMTAVCESDPRCGDDVSSNDLPCRGTTDPACPLLGPVTASVSSTCNPDGTRTVTISVDVSPGSGGSAVVQIINEAGLGPSAEFVDAPQTTVTADLDYPSGTHSADVIVIAPEGCGGSSVSFDVRPCDVVAVCPDITFTTDQGACDSSGQRSLQVTAHVVLASGNPVSARLVPCDSNGNPTGAPLDTGSDANGDLTLSGSGTFPGDTVQHFKVDITDPPGCGGTIQNVDLPPCETCPDIAFEADLGDCDRQGRRAVQVEAHVVRASGGSVSARLFPCDANGNSTGPDLDSGTDAGGNLTLTGGGVFNGGTTQRFKVEVTDPAGCPGSVQSVDVPACRPIENGPPPCPWWWLLPLGLTLLGLGVVLVILATCLPGVPPPAMLTLMIAGSVAGSGSSILLLLWAVLCRDCATIKTVLLLLAGVFDLLAIVAIILFVLAMPVCGTGVLSAAVIVGGVAFQLLMPYLYQCGTGCMPTRILLGVLMALTGALLIAAVIVGLIGILGAPALLPVAVGLYIAGVIAMAVTLNVMVAFLLLCD